MSRELEFLSKQVAFGRISRRNFLGRAAALGVTAVSANALLSSAVRAAGPMKGGTIKVGIEGGSTTDTMDPALSTNNTSTMLLRLWGEPLVELEPVEDPPTDHVGHLMAHVVLRIDDVVRADALEDATVVLAHRLGPDRRHLELVEGRGGEDARLQVGADGHDGVRQVVHAELAERLHARDVGLHDVGDGGRVVLHGVLVAVDAEHVVAEAHQLGRDGTAEPTEAEDDDRVAARAPGRGSERAERPLSG